MKIRSLLLFPLLLLILVSCSDKTRYNMLGLEFNIPYELVKSQGFVPVDAWRNINKAKMLKYGSDEDGFVMMLKAFEYKSEIPATDMDVMLEIASDRIYIMYEVPSLFTTDDVERDDKLESKIRRGTFEVGKSKVNYIYAVYKDGLKTWSFEIYYTDKRIKKDPHIVTDVEEMLKSVRYTQKQEKE